MYVVCMRVHAMAHYGHVIRRQQLEAHSVLSLWVLEIKLRSVGFLAAEISSHPTRHFIQE